MSVISFARGAPAPECLAVELIADCAKAAVERDGVTVLSYGTGLGYAPLREWIGECYGVDPGRILLTNGSLQGFGYLSQYLLAELKGKRVLVEAPSYDRTLLILRKHGVEITAIEMDDEGIDPDQLERELQREPKPAFLYTIPSFQNPSGRTLSAERRKRIVELAQAYDLLVLEDDPYGLVRYDGEALPTLFELEGSTAAQIIHASSFSKTISPGLRVGFLVLPERMVKALEAIASSTTISPSNLPAATVCEFVRRGHFEPNLERMNKLLCLRRDAMLAALERHFGSSAHWSHPQGGYFNWLELPGDVDTGELLPRAVEAGVVYCQGSDFYPDGRGRNAIRLAYSYPTPEEIERGIAILADLVKG